MGLKVLRWCIASLITFQLLPAQVVPGRYIVELTGQPAVQSKKAASRSAVRSEQNRAAAEFESRGIQVLDSVEVVANALVVHASEEQAAELAAMPGVAAVEPVRIYKLLLDRAIVLQKVTGAWALVGGEGNAGTGIKIGIIDTGIDSSHPAFQDASLPAVAGFPKTGNEVDLAYTNNKVIVARSYGNGSGSARDRKGHGTSVAMIAAGMTNSGPRGAITGIAPKAYLGNYKVFPDDEEGAPTDGILKALDDAVSDGMDVVNLSLGSFPAPRPANDILVRAVDRAAAAGVVVSVAAGNEGPDSGTIGTPATSSSVIAVGNSANDRIFASSVKLGDADAIIAIAGSGRNPETPVTAPIFDIARLDPSSLACQSLPAGSLRGSIAVILRGDCTFEEKLNNAGRAGALAALVYARADNPEAIPMAVGAATLPAMMVSNGDGVSLLDAARKGADSLTMNFLLSAIAVNPARISGGSSRGPGTDLGIKPDLLAVGSSVYTAAPLDSPGKGYTVASGTSLSSPMVAGAAAVLKAARPGLTDAQYRSLLVNSSSTFSLDSVTPGPVEQTGSGLLNLEAAVRSTITAAPVSLSFGTLGSTVNTAQSFRLTNLSSEADTFSLLVQQVSGSTAPTLSSDAVQLGPGESKAVEIRIEGSSLPPGEYSGFALVHSAQTGSEARIPYWLGVPSDVAEKLVVPEPPTSGKIGSTQTILVRASDKSGIPLVRDPVVTAVSGGGTVVSTRSIDRQYPGFYQIQVKLGDIIGPYEFKIESAGASASVTIRAN